MSGCWKAGDRRRWRRNLNPAEHPSTQHLAAPAAPYPRVYSTRLPMTLAPGTGLSTCEAPRQARGGGPPSSAPVYCPSVENIYFELTEAFNAEAPTVALASGHAVVFYRIAIMSKDGDWIIRESPDACDRVLAELERRGARYRLGPPLDVGSRWLVESLRVLRTRSGGARRAGRRGAPAGRGGAGRGGRRVAAA